MHFFSFATILLLVSLISACSSGSSDDPDSSTSTDSPPTDGSTGENESSEIVKDDPGAGTETNEQNPQEENMAEVPTIDPESDFGQLQDRISILTGRTLIALNQKLTQGEPLTVEENNCLGTFDPAMGEPLLAINCAQPLAIGDVPIFMGIAAFEDTPACNTSLQSATTDGCTVDQATLQINTLFIAPEMGTAQPEVGASITYNIEQDQLTIDNLPDALSGVFQCQYDVATGIANGEQIGDCDAQLVHLVNLIDLHLVAGS